MKHVFVGHRPVLVAVDIRVIIKFECIEIFHVFEVVSPAPTERTHL
jgi:hypothetical protein